MDSTRTLGAPDEAGLRTLLAELAEESRGFRFDTAPNPCVGAAILARGREVARGFHREWGGPHAEVNALCAAGQSGVPRDRWDTLVVTLEPCSSAGKTGPCSRAILEAGIDRVVVGALDPDARHRGAGIRLLADAGVAVEVLERSARLEEVAPQFLRWNEPERLRRRRPWTVAKWAQTRTGQLTPPAGVGDGRRISGPEALAEVCVLRGRVDAIVTGVGTILADDPRLTVRSPGDRTRRPLRVVLDSELRTPPTARVLAAECGQGVGGDVHLLCRAGAAPARHRGLEAAGARVHSLHPGSSGHVSLRAVQEWLWDRGARRVLVEAGPTLLAGYFEGGFVDQVVVYTGDVAGGRGSSMGEWIRPERIQHPSHREVGRDSVLEGFVGL